jgi:DNA-binding transcriptional ArsR family regulator
MSSAVYLITSLWDDREPMKWFLREKNISVLDELSKYNYRSNIDRARIFSNLSSRIAEVLSLLEISFNSGLVSEMNLRVLTEEYKNLLKVIKEKETGFLALPKDFFNKVDNQSLPSESVVKSLSDSSSYKGHLKDNKMSFTHRPSSRTLRDNSKSKEGDRRKLIIDLVKSRGEITINDAVSIIRNVSEKTIQRELISLTNEGILLKKGERRWSRYSLAKK